ncbi:hypothetical protein BJY04DRAFT_214185 [Aspergillus karnatakaensis]|uniref:uncharacterized protein n=1 Tax=Aspergillus karnatakaensis TaxID=1810916 RepID=UPI003CCE4609
MVTLRASVLASVATVLSVIGTNAANIGFCTDASCSSSCPLYHDTLDYPNCWSVPVDNLDNKGYELNPAGGYIVYLDVPQPESGCAFIIGSGIDCGVAVGRFENAICVRQAWTTTLTLTHCCGECGGVGASLNGIPVEGNLLESRSVAKRDCSTWTTTEAAHDSYGSNQAVSNVVTGPADVQISKTVTTGRSSSFSLSVGDPYGVASASTGITFEESTSTALSYTFQVLEGQTGYIAWTPLVSCVDGTLSGCDGASDETGTLCTPKKDSDGNVVGQYTFVSSARVAKPLKA